VMSMIKRRQGSHVHGRTYHSQCRDLRLMVLTHNLMILIFIKVFYRARHERITQEPLRIRSLPRGFSRSAQPATPSSRTISWHI